MFDNPNADLNSNFDGFLDADSCSFDSFSQDDSSDMDTFSDVDLTDNSEDEIIVTNGIERQGYAYNNDSSLYSTSTLLQTDTTKAALELSEQGPFRSIINNNIINNGVRREGDSGREEEEQQHFFNFTNEEKAKPQLLEVGLLQDLAAASSSSSHSAGHVVDHKCVKDCECIYAPTSMYSMYGMQAQKSF
jgi:hypothetical protein